jgi:2-methylcitrate dehydratase PrpD
VLEGRFGLLEAFCEDYEPALLTKGLGREYQIERLCLKSYGLHVTAQAPVQLLRGWIAEHGFSGDDIAALAIEGSAKVLSHHSDVNPADIMLAQYSVPFAVALSAYYDPLDPAVFSDRTVGDPRVRGLAKRISLSGGDHIKGWGTRMRLTLRDGRAFEAERDSFLGCPETPMSADQLRLKFDKLTQGCSEKLRRTLFDDLMRIEQLQSLEALTLS